MCIRDSIYLRPAILQAMFGSHPGLDLDQLGAVDVLEEDHILGEIALNSRPTLRFHGSIPALTEPVSYTHLDVYKRQPMGRFATPDDIAHAIAFLADDNESGFINGHTLSVDGGWASDGSWESLRLRKR